VKGGAVGQKHGLVGASHGPWRETWSAIVPYWARWIRIQEANGGDEDAYRRGVYAMRLTGYAKLAAISLVWRVVAANLASLDAKRSS
jgi:hypothetical protein